ncbi:DUF5362 family protein [Parabacteroides sp. FAFU027]|uniref:DUF5362 family protein n=1 Tax=Parabacteroides sp. FAFU027 TaxID=2922715 RepID=UPI001FB00139|nr:DUF5362 family protein [Parabacteroides sp. FAFU027]
MENYQQENTEETTQTVLTLSSQTISFLDEIRKWTKFFAILGFIGIGFMVLLAIFMGTASSIFPMFGNGFGGGSIFIAILYLAFAGLYAMPVIYLNNFSDKLKIALEQSRNEELESAFENLKSHFKFVGIMSIIMLAIYVIAIIFAIGGSILAFH